MNRTFVALTQYPGELDLRLQTSSGVQAGRVHRQVLRLEWSCWRCRTPPLRCRLPFGASEPGVQALVRGIGIGR